MKQREPVFESFFNPSLFYVIEKFLGTFFKDEAYYIVITFIRQKK